MYRLQVCPVSSLPILTETELSSDLKHIRIKSENGFHLHLKLTAIRLFHHYCRHFVSSSRKISFIRQILSHSVMTQSLVMTYKDWSWPKVRVCNTWLRFWTSSESIHQVFNRILRVVQLILQFGRMNRPYYIIVSSFCRWITTNYRIF